MAGHRWEPIAPHVTVVHPVRVDPHGRTGPTKARAAGPHWRCSSPAHYVPTATDRTVPEQRIVEEAMRLPAYGAVTGWAGMRLAGAAWCDGLAPDGRTPLPVGLAVGTRGGVRRHDGIEVSFERLPEWEVWVRYGVRCARPERAVFDEMRKHGRREALVVLETALAGRITSLPRVAAYAAAHPSARRSPVVGWALERGRGHARSPLEVRVRTTAEEDAGYARMEVNRVVLDADGRRIGEVDLLDVDSGTVIEVDGADHREADQQAWDISKEEALRRVGLEVARVTGSQSRDAVALAERLAVVRARSRFAPQEERAWQLAPRTFDLEDHLREQEDLALWHEHARVLVG